MINSSASGRQRVAVLGSSGSIGVNTLDVLSRHPDRYEIFALAARSSVDTVFEQCRKYHPRYVLLTDDAAAAILAKRLATDAALDTEVLAGTAALEQIAAHVDVDIVMAAIVGSAGMASAMAAARAGKRLLLANKEALVTAGSLLMRAVEDSGATLLPVDSEHNAIFQCLPADSRARPQLEGVSGLILTASGGPFRGKSREFLAKVTPEQACAHPNWDMGRKISVDSASLMNKGLELAEACWLFGLPENQVEVVVHPQSIVHSLVRYADGSVLAQLGEPDMRTPIACCLAWPERIDGGVKALDLVAAARLDFEPPDMELFPCLRIARECIASGGSAMAVCNAANEIAVAAFLEGQIGFVDIAAVIEASLAGLPLIEPRSLAEVEEVDRQARAFADQYVKNHRHSISYQQAASSRASAGVVKV
ncbi:1-deoxy-D-xylulose-5-phosphate reductoisomerase [Congregibacter sp.]|nr:1-deoxy-D-xylulose-5-phosphate reductoisomerase [Congregibacter sp.]MDA8961940.1 1-deoxy-D-xylulose-5-phosphate reductoisomerase [Congregibacter sp.]